MASSKEFRSVWSFENAIYDLDGTLIRSVHAAVTAFVAIAAEFDVPPGDAEELYRSTTGQPLRRQFATLLKSRNVPHSEAKFIAAEAHFSRVFVRAECPWFDGARDHLLGAKRAGLKLFISSASPDHLVEKRFDGDGELERAFVLKLGSTRIPKGHHHVERIRRSASASIADPVSPERFSSTTFFCGDSEEDMRIATAANLYAIGVRGTVSDERLLRAGARRLVNSVAELANDPR